MGGIIRQTSWLFFAQILTRGIGFLYTIYLARTLGVADFGAFSAALAYYSLLSTLAELGFNRYLVLEISVDQSKISGLIWTVGYLRLMLTILLFIVFSVVLYFTDPDQLRVNLTILSALAIIPLAVGQTVDAAFVAIRKLQYSAISLVILSLVTTITGVYLVSSGFGAVGAAIALSIGSIFYLLGEIFFLKTLKLITWSKAEYQNIKSILIKILPYGLLGVLGLLYFRIDTLMVTYMLGNYDAGIYTAAYKFLEAVVFIPSAIATAVFPVTANLLSSDPKKVYDLYKKTLWIMLGLALIITVTYLTLLPFVITVLLPNYLQAISVVNVLSITIPFMFMISIQGIVLLSHKKFLTPLIYFSVFNLFFNVFLNLCLIPIFGVMGAAYATVASDIIGFCIFFIYIRKQFT